MQVAGKEVFAAAGLAGEQYGSLVLGDLQGLLAQLLELTAAANRFGDRLDHLAQADVFTLQAVVLQSMLDGQQQLGQGERFFNVVIGTESGCLYRGLHIAVSGHDDHRLGQWLLFRPLLEQGNAVHVGHPDVEKDQIRALATAGLAG